MPHIINTEVSDREKTSKAWKMERKVNQHTGTSKQRKRKQNSMEQHDPAKKQQRSAFFSNLDSVAEIPEAGSEDEVSSDEEDLPATS